MLDYKEVKLSDAVEEHERLHKELLEIKGKETFREFGFGLGGPHCGWMEEIKGLREGPVEARLQKSLGFSFALLLSIATAYVYSGGLETDFTRRANRLINKKIYKK